MHYRFLRCGNSSNDAISCDDGRCMHHRFLRCEQGAAIPSVVMTEMHNHRFLRRATGAATPSGDDGDACTTDSCGRQQV